MTNEVSLYGSSGITKECKFSGIVVKSAENLLLWQLFAANATSLVNLTHSAMTCSSSTTGVELTTVASPSIVTTSEESGGVGTPPFSSLSLTLEVETLCASTPVKAELASISEALSMIFISSTSFFKTVFIFCPHKKHIFLQIPQFNYLNHGRPKKPRLEKWYLQTKKIDV